MKYTFDKMPKKKKKIKTKKEKNGLSKITDFTTKSLSNAFVKFKKNQELKKITYRATELNI